MPVILPDYGLRAQLPQPRVMVAASSDQIRAVGAKGTVPDPSLMALQTRLERESRRFLRVLDLGARGVAVGEARVRDGVGHVLGRGGWGADAAEGGGGGSQVGDDGPDPRVVVRAAGREVAHVGGEQHARDVGGVRGERADGDEGGDVAVLD